MKEFEDILEEISHNLEWCDDAYQSRCYRRSHDEITRLRADLAAVTEERDTLAARLAPVDDEELVEIVAKVLQGGYETEWSVLPEEWKKDWLRDARVAIAAIRPHIEAAEREKWQKMLARMGAGTTKTGAVNE